MSKACQHHWLLEPPQPGKETVRGTCKHCGAIRDDPAFEDHAFNKRFGSRRANARRAAVAAKAKAKKKASA